MIKGILTCIIIVIIVCINFLKKWPAFGKKPTLKNNKKYQKRAINYTNQKFSTKSIIYLKEGIEGKTISKKGTIPTDEIPVEKPKFIKKLKKEDFTITWFGHSTVFLQLQKLNIIIDPVFSKITSPISFIGPKRYCKFPIQIDELPSIDIVIITHDHYDHLDYKTIRKIDKKTTKYIVQLGIENHLISWGIDEKKIINMSWWEELNFKDLQISSTPAYHYSRRSVFDKNKTLFSSWVIKSDLYKIFISGDTGFSNHFEQIYNKYGPFDIALLENGQYDKKWSKSHMTPEQSIIASRKIHAKNIIPIHWGTYKLAYHHPWDDPIERFTKKASKMNINTITPIIGQTVNYKEKEKCKTIWWKNIR